MSEAQEVFDILDGLSSPSADTVYTDVREYDTRDVLAAVGATAKASGGGSQPGIKSVDSGIITRADVLSGPVVVWTPAAGEFIIGGFAISGDCVDANANELVIGLSSWDNVQAGLLSSAGSGIGFSQGVDIPAVGPVYAGLNDSASTGVSMLWTADTVITNGGPSTLAAGHIWQGDQGGTTGNSTPDFAGNLGGSVMDNGITWTDIGAVASNSCQIRGFVVALVTS